MLSKAKIKFIKSLQIKKYRKEEQCFIVEGAKSVRELLTSDFEIASVIGTAQFLSNTRFNDGIEVIEVSERELAGLGDVQSNDAAIAVAKIKSNIIPEVSSKKFALVLDDIRDPGNLGTIIRTADWFGITSVIASEETADFYNPKVIRATMGSFTRVRLGYTNLVEYLHKNTLPVFGAYLNGQDIRTMDFGSGGLLVVGNESNGIHTSLEQFVRHKVTIPKFGGAESLNAGIATAILCFSVRQNISFNK